MIDFGATATLVLDVLRVRCDRIRSHHALTSLFVHEECGPKDLATALRISVVQRLPEANAEGSRIVPSPPESGGITLTGGK